MNCNTNCWKLYENNLAGEKWVYAVTLDEALIYLDTSMTKLEFVTSKRSQRT